MATAQGNLARKQIFIPASQPEAVALRVAAYCRVSTDSEDQLNSFAAQQSYYNDYIRNHDSWQLSEIYADATDIIGLKQNPTNGRRFSPIFSFIGHFSIQFEEMLLLKQRRKTEYGKDKAFVDLSKSMNAFRHFREQEALWKIQSKKSHWRTKNFVASLMVQNLVRELCSVANEHGGRLPNQAVFFCDELGTMPPFDILPLFSAGRSRRLTLVPIILSLAQREKNYDKEGSEILCNNCQDTIFGGFAPNSQTAATLSSNLGSRTVLSGSVIKGKNDDFQSLQMMEHPLMSADELKAMPKGSFVVMKTGTHPMQTKLKLFFDWGIQFEKLLQMPERGSRLVYYAGKEDLERSILRRFPLPYGPAEMLASPKVQTAVKLETEKKTIRTSTEE